MNSELTCADFYQPKKPEPKVAKTVKPDKPAKDFFAWAKYIYNLRNKKVA